MPTPKVLRAIVIGSTWYPVNGGPKVIVRGVARIVLVDVAIRIDLVC